MLPVGGHKGYGLALIVEILSAVVAGAAFGPHLGTLYADFDRGQDVGHFFAALDPSGFGPLSGFWGGWTPCWPRCAPCPGRPG